MANVATRDWAASTPSVDFSPVAVNLTFQGGFVRCGFELAGGSAAGGGRRGVVNEFSAASRRRLLALFARLNLAGQKTVFLTLTYGQAFPGPREAKKHRREFWRRLKRRYGAAASVWRLEFQKRGAPHFHMVVFGLPFVPKEVLQEMWAAVIGPEFCDRSGGMVRPPFTRIELIADKRRLVAYVSKYVAKSDAGTGGFNLSAYLRNGQFVHPVTGEMCGSVGRWWGVDNVAGLPLGREIVVRIVGEMVKPWKRRRGMPAVQMTPEQLKPVYQLRRGARHKFAGTARRRCQGFSLYVDDAGRWFDYWLYLVVSS